MLVQQATIVDQHALELTFQGHKGIGASTCDHGEFTRLFSDGCGLIVVIFRNNVALVVALNTTTIGIGLV